MCLCVCIPVIAMYVCMCVLMVVWECVCHGGVWECVCHGGMGMCMSWWYGNVNLSSKYHHTCDRSHA